MGDASIHCPECGAPAPFRGTTVTLVCEYCSATIVRDGVDLHLVGKVSAILDQGSPVVLGGRGKVDGVGFEIVGRLQLRHARGLWNEWYLQFADGRDGWLADAQGSFYVARRIDGDAVVAPAWDVIGIGRDVTIDGGSLRVVERRVATYQGAEGCLPFVATPGRSFRSVDLLDEDGRFATLDYGEGADRPEVYLGRAVSLTALAVRPLREFEGWHG